MKDGAVEEIKERLSIVDVVAPHVKITRAGKSLIGLCPFHKEKTPSFHVSAERGTYHCFGCGEGGDIFSFIEKVDGVDFKTALKMLAEKAGVKLESRQGGEDTSRKERLREAMQKAGQWYAGKLAGTAAEVYAKKRGLTPETIGRWNVGYAPDGWRGLLEEFSTHGFTTDELLGAGLIKEADGKPGTYYDRFRDRLMFPINDVAGRVVAFTGRALSADEMAKYLNSPETPLYHKSDVLFGMDKAKDAIRVRGFAILVEGQMDAVLAHQAGFENVIALSGTALTERHVALLKRYSENLMLVLDADTAGLTATAKSAQLALREGLRVKAVRLPLGKDPADLICEDPQDFAARVKSAKPVVEFFLSVLAEKEPDPHRLLRTAEAVVLPLIAAMKSPMEREHFIQSTARALSLSTEAVRESLGRLPKEGAAVATTIATAPRTPTRPSKELRAEQLLGALRAYAGTPLAKRIETEYARITEAPVPSIKVLAESVAFEAEQTFGENPKEEAADELLHAFEKAVIREAYQEAVANLRRAESAGDPVAVQAAQELCTTLSARLAPFGN
jgi:DNA primase